MGLFIIAVIVLLICVCVSRIGSEDLREVAVAVEIVFSILTVGAAISLPLSIMNNIKVVNRHHVLKEILQSPNKKCDYILYNDALKVNDAIMAHRSYADNFWIGIWYDKDVAELELLK
jgi:hypothetical protein